MHITSSAWICAFWDLYYSLAIASVNLPTPSTPMRLSSQNTGSSPAKTLQSGSDQMYRYRQYNLNGTEIEAFWTSKPN